MRYFLLLSLLLLMPGVLFAEDRVDFAKQIQPLLVGKCAKCHGVKNAKGDLRLHAAAAIRDADVDYLLNSENPEDGELLIRITLPKDDEMFMPKGGKPLLEDEIALIRKWIEQGAAMPESEQIAEKSPEEKLPDVEPASQETIDKLIAAGAQVLELFSGSPLLRVTFAYAEEEVGDDQVAILSEAADQIIWLNLARSNVTDSGTAPLATLKNLSHLHLEQTSIGDNTLVHVAGLENLSYLNLYGTKVTDAGLEYLKELKNLENIYLWQTGVTYEAAMALQNSHEGREVNLGWNHPEVAKRRLAKELERVTKREKEAKAREEQAKQEREAAAKRQVEIKKKLEALDPKVKEETEKPKEGQSDKSEAETEPAEKSAEKELTAKE